MNRGETGACGGCAGAVSARWLVGLALVLGWRMVGCHPEPIPLPYLEVSCADGSTEMVSDEDLDGVPDEAVCGECHVRTQLHKNLGLIMAQSGDDAGAVDELAIAHDLSPDDRDIEYALELLRKRAARANP